MDCGHFLDRHGDKRVHVFKIRASDLAIHDRLRARPGFAFWVKNENPLLLSGLNVEHPAFGCADGKRGFWAVNNSAAILFLPETSRADEQEKSANDKKRFHEWARICRFSNRFSHATGEGFHLFTQARKCEAISPRFFSLRSRLFFPLESFR